MKKTILFLSVMAVIMMFSSITEASPLDPTNLGAANGYNVFVRGNYGSLDADGIYDTHNSDTEGRLAAGGDINIRNYSVGLKAPQSEYSMVSGGNIDFTSGHVFNGGIYAAGNISLTSAGVDTGAIITPNGSSSPIDFNHEFAYLDDLSESLSLMAATGTTVVKTWGTIYLTGTESVNYFNVNGTDLDNSCGLIFDIGVDDKAIVNISGDSNTFSGFGIFGVDGKERDVVYNFFDSELLSIGSIDVRGNILAPYADVTFNSGVINGNLIANSFRGTGQSNWQPYPPNNPVPEPGTMILLGTGLVGIFSMRKKFSAKKPSDN